MSRDKHLCTHSCKIWTKRSVNQFWNMSFSPLGLWQSRNKNRKRNIQSIYTYLPPWIQNPIEASAIQIKLCSQVCIWIPITSFEIKWTGPLGHRHRIYVSCSSLAHLVSGHSIYIMTVTSQRLFSALMNWFKLVYVPFGQSNMHRTLNFCPEHQERNQTYQS